MVIGKGHAAGFLSEADIDSIVAQAVDQLAVAGQRVLVIIPDGTRTIPLPLFFRLLVRYLEPRAAAVDFLVALGTHPPMSDEALLRLVGITAEEKATRYKNVQLLNHAWDQPEALTTLGTIAAEEIAELSGGLLREAVPVRLNRQLLECDQILICGPVFPHEVAGFSGGNKYFFPGVAGSDIINLTHWLGALVTSYAIIGTKDTPVRQVINRAATLIPRPRHALCSVVTHEGVAGLFFGTPEAAFDAAADLSAQVHIRWVDRPYRQILAIMPEMYDDLWVGAKGMYKAEPAVADGGEVIIYAPHITEISATHGRLIREVGYHVLEYFTKQWEKFSHIPTAVLAHSTHVRGIGTYDAPTATEYPRITVTLATGIPEAVCRQVNLNYRDPATLRPETWAAEHGSEDVLVIPRAGEYLYRVK